MIDLKNKPEGATHYDKGPIRYFKYSDDKKDMYYFTGDGCVKLSHWPRAGTVFKIPEWSIYNNTLPLSELGDDQRGLLFNHWFKDRSSIEHTTSVGDDTWYSGGSIAWNEKVVYRAKQKTERELFVEQALESFDIIKLLDGDNITLLEAMFDAGFKAPKVGE
jgi:hypothetical protein